jgi:hypothetical protein
LINIFVANVLAMLRFRNVAAAEHSIGNPQPINSRFSGARISG